MKIIVVLAIIFSQDAITQQSNKIFHKVDVDFIRGCESGKGCIPFVIERKFSSDSLIIIFPNGGTITEVFLFDAGELLKKNKNIRNSLTRTNQVLHEMDITALPDGKYFVQMISCSLGGGFELIIKTNTLNIDLNCIN